MAGAKSIGLYGSMISTGTLEGTLSKELCWFVGALSGMRKFMGEGGNGAVYNQGLWVYTW